MEDIFSCLFPKTEFGSGKMQEVGNTAKKYGCRAFLASDPFLKANGTADKVRKLLESSGISSVVFSDIQPNPSCFSIDGAAQLCMDEKCDMIIAIGGGSAMDFGKAVSIVAANGGKSWEYTERADHDTKRPKSSLPLIAVPTTSGTGSETTPFAVLNNPNIKEKSTIVSRPYFPA